MQLLGTWTLTMVIVNAANGQHGQVWRLRVSWRHGGGPGYRNGVNVGSSIATVNRHEAPPDGLNDDGINPRARRLELARRAAT